MNNCKEFKLFQKSDTENFCIQNYVELDNKYINETQICVANCPSILYWIKQNSICRDHCETFYQIENKLECESNGPIGLFKDDKNMKCIASCPKKTNRETKECADDCKTSPDCQAAIVTYIPQCETYCKVQGIEDCSKHKEENIAQKESLLNDCKTKYYENENDCVLTCSGKLHDKMNMKCVDDCPPDLLTDKDNKVCVKECSLDSFKYNAGSLCVKNCKVHSMYNDM